MKLFSFSHTDLDLHALRAQLADATAGGYAAFEGWVRNHNEGLAVTRLEYEAFEALADKEGQRIVQEAIDRFGVVKAACVHRVGSLGIGDLAVWVGVSSRHRAEAFAACRYIIDEVKHRVPIWKKEHYANGDSGWVNCERCAAPPAEQEARATGQRATVHSHHHDHHDHDQDNHSHDHSNHPAQAPSPRPRAPGPAPQALLPNYSRQIALKHVGIAGQAKLAAARVLVIGAGGLGVPVLTYLAGAGVGTLGIVDGDTLDASNLHRQTLYALADVGQGKVELAAKRLRELNPAIAVIEHSERIDGDNAEQLIRAYDLIIECSDNFATKFLVNDAAVRCSKPAIFASVYQYEGQLQAYRPDRENACLRCLWPDATRDGVVGNCAEAGVLGPVPGVFGSLQALEALKLLLGLPGQLVDDMLLIDLLTLEQRKLHTTHRADCIHDASRTLTSAPPDLELIFGELQTAVIAGYTVIDVRDPQEVSDAPLPPTRGLQIPLSTLLQGPTALNPEHRYLLVCARGSRSRAGAEHLREQGFRYAYTLRGGVAALGKR